jgi:dUTPase
MFVIQRLSQDLQHSGNPQHALKSELPRQHNTVHKSVKHCNNDHKKMVKLNVSINLPSKFLLSPFPRSNVGIGTATVWYLAFHSLQ